MNKAPGIDSVSTMLIELADEISDILSVLLNESLSTADVSLDWKLANVTAVFKKGEKSSVNQSINMRICIAQNKQSMSSNALSVTALEQTSFHFLAENV